jgi:hypothetical protein
LIINKTATLFFVPFGKQLKKKQTLNDEIIDVAG